LQGFATLRKFRAAVLSQTT